MTYTERAKDLYEAFQNAMGEYDHLPFERLSVREMLAWQVATGETSEMENELDAAEEEIKELNQELTEAKDEAAEAREDHARAMREVERLESEVEELKKGGKR